MRIKDKFEDFLEHLKKRGLTEKTIRENRRFIYGAISHTKIKDKKVSELKIIDKDDIIEAGRQHGVWGPTRALSVWRCYLNFLEDSGIRLPFNPTKIKIIFPPHKEQSVFTKEELEIFLDSFPLDNQNTGAKRMAWTMKTFFEVLFGTTARGFEIMQLQRKQWEEIKKNKEAIITGKGGDERKIYFLDRSIYWLEKYLEQRTDLCPAMFVNSYGEPLKMVTAKSYYLRFRKRFPEELAKKIKFHTLRRTSTTMMLERGMDLKSIQIIGGWKSERTILRHYAIANRKRAKLEYNRVLAKI